MTWNDLLDAIATRLGEPDIRNAVVPSGEPDIPYYTSDNIERKLLEISQQLLREIPPDELESIGSPALRTDIMASGGTLIFDTVKIVSVTIKPLSTSAQYLPSEPKDPAAFLQVKTVDPSVGTYWTVIGNALQYTGFLAQMVSIVETPLADWRTIFNILPESYDETRIDWVTKQLQIADWIPVGIV